MSLALYVANCDMFLVAANCERQMVAAGWTDAEQAAVTSDLADGLFDETLARIVPQFTPHVFDKYDSWEDPNRPGLLLSEPRRRRAD